MLSSFTEDKRSCASATLPKLTNASQPSRIQSIFLGPAHLSKVVFPEAFDNHRLTISDDGCQSTRTFIDYIRQAVILLEQKIIESNETKHHGVIIVSLLDRFSFFKGKVDGSSCNLAKMVRFITAISDLVMHQSNFNLIIVMPYMHNSDHDLKMIQNMENDLQKVLCFDQDLSGHMFSRIRLFSILKKNTDWANKESIFEKKDDRNHLTTFGYQFIGLSLSQDIAGWLANDRFPKLNLAKPLHFEPGRLSDYIRQISSKSMVSNLCLSLLPSMCPQDPVQSTRKSKNKAVKKLVDAGKTSDGPILEPSDAPEKVKKPSQARRKSLSKKRKGAEPFAASKAAKQPNRSFYPYQRPYPVPSGGPRRLPPWCPAPPPFYY